MNQVRKAAIFEQILLSYVEMYYSMSLVLTQNHDEARNLERNILMWVWHHLNSEAGRMEIKRKFLKVIPWVGNILDSEEGMNMAQKKILKLLHKKCLQDHRIKPKQPREQKILYLFPNYQTTTDDTFISTSR